MTSTGLRRPLERDQEVQRWIAPKQRPAGARVEDSRHAHVSTGWGLCGTSDDSCATRRLASCVVPSHPISEAGRTAKNKECVTQIVREGVGRRTTAHLLLTHQRVADSVRRLAGTTNGHPLSAPLRSSLQTERVYGISREQIRASRTSVTPARACESSLPPVQAYKSSLEPAQTPRGSVTPARPSHASPTSRGASRSSPPSPS